MIPDIHHPVWMEIVTGKRPIQSSKATVNLLIHNNKMKYSRDQSQQNVESLIAATHEFFYRFEKLFADEVAQICR